MTTDDTDSIPATQRPYPSEDDGDAPAERIEEWITGRREFLLGLVGGGALGSAVVGLGWTGSDVGFQSLATVAGGETAGPTRYHLPAVDPEGGGLVVGLNVSLKDGDGDVFVNLEGVELRHDLQAAIHESTRTATRLTGRTLETTDLSLTFSVPGSDDLTVLRGKSWEAGLTVALVGALRRRRLSSDVLVTGVIASDGALLPVGGIEEKARAARESGADRLLVPPGQTSGGTPAGIRVEVVPTIDAVVREVLG